MQPVGAFIQILPLNRDRISESDTRILIRTSPPYLPVRNEFAPDLASIGQRPMIVNGDIGDANTLRHYRVLAGPRQVEHQCFAGGGLSLTEARE